MSQKIRNRADILSHGDVKSREIVLDITEKTLQRLDSYQRIKSIMHMEGDILHIGTKSWDLSKKKNVYLLGAGKACNHMAMAVDEVLGDHLTRGIAIVKISEPTDVFRKTEVYVGGHPLPNEEGLRACHKILDIVDNAGPDDLFIVVISGGSSALMSCPIEGLTLQDEIDVTDVMLKSGANIFEINAIRRHISQMNGGMLAKRIEARGSELIGFGISDAVASPATGERCDAMLRRLNARIDADGAMQRPARFAWRRWMSAAAAAAVVVIAVAAAWLAGLRLPEAGRFQSYANHTGDVAVLHLEDGTQVWLQDGTELRYAVGKGAGERIVRLDGEAYFDVSHDARQPFVVETRELAIRVLGTAFNVRALAGDPLTEVVLERGVVRLETPGGDNLVRLHPNQRAVYDARMGDMEVAEINAPLYVTRRYNLVTMKGATITEIIAGIEKSYGVRIRIMSPDDGKRYDINYLRSNSLEEVVDIVEFMTGTHCEVIRNE